MLVCFVLCFSTFSFHAEYIVEDWWRVYYEFSSQEEYDDFLEKNVVPPDFVRYQDISFLGSFRKFTSESEDLATYTYFINCPNEKERIIFALEFFEKFKPPSNVVNAPEDNNFAQNSYAEDFYKSGSKKNCACQVGNVFYIYSGSSKELTEIQWIDTERNLWFSLRGDFDCCLREFGAPETAVEARNRLLEATGCFFDASVEQYAPFSCVTEEAYVRYLEERSVPSEFIQYQEVSFLGNFYEFYSGGDSLSMYQYILGCSKEKHLMVLRTLSPWKFNPPQNIVVAPEDLDFAKIGDATGEDTFDSKDCVYQVGNVFYYYNGHHPSSEQASLRGIRWVDPERGIWYSISGFSKCCLPQFKDPETAVEARNRLLKASDCAFVPNFDPSNVFDTPSDVPLTDGTDAVSTATETPTAPAPFPWLWVIVPAGAVLIAAAATTALVIRKKKKQ